MEKKRLSNILKNQKKNNISKKEEKKIKEYHEKQEKNEQYLKQLKENLNKSKKYYDYDNRDYKGIRDIENLFGEVNEEDYYKPVKTKGAFNNNYIEYESKGDKDKNLSLEKWLDMIRPYLRDMINNYKALLGDDQSYGESKIQLTMKINLISSLDTGEIRTMDSNSKNIEILMGGEIDDIIDELLKSFLQRYQEKLEEQMRGSEFVFESVDLLFYSLHKTRLRRGKSYIKSPEWLKNKEQQ